MEFSAIESLANGFDHASCAAIAFEAWQLPMWLHHVVAAHHDPMGAPAECRDLAVIVSLADQICAQTDATLQKFHGPALADQQAMQEFLELESADIEQTASCATQGYGALASAADD